ncbi:ABC transporter ATP-binding protein [Candidatus Gracilibacteria bacterium]|nr:ABC transporter ATP-binding protein [Candidatus Gracilibacteria bacterium]
MTSIELRHVSKRFPRQPRPAADAVSLTVAAGTLVALLGPSGSGKSTLLKLIAGVEVPDSGAIYLDSQDMTAVPAHRRGAVLMFQKAYLFPFLSVAENIAFGLKMQRGERATIQAEVRRMLDLVELPGIERKNPAQLSGGEQQRVALARALVTRPRVLLLDEPFSSLDPTVRQNLQEAVRRIQRELGTTTLLVTHDRSEALAMADQVALLDYGALLAYDTPQQLFHRPPTRQAARLMGVTTFLSGELRGDRLVTAMGTLLVCGTGMASGHTTFAIRPEHLRLSDTPGPNRLHAHILAQTFRGEQSDYQLRVGDETLRLTSFEPVAASVGDFVYVELPSAHLFCVRDDEPASERSKGILPAICWSTLLCTSLLQHGALRRYRVAHFYWARFCRIWRSGCSGFRPLPTTDGSAVTQVTRSGVTATTNSTSTTRCGSQGTTCSTRQRSCCSAWPCYGAGAIRRASQRTGGSGCSPAAWCIRPSTSHCTSTTGRCCFSPSSGLCAFAARSATGTRAILAGSSRSLSLCSTWFYSAICADPGLDDAFLAAVATMCHKHE